MNDWQLIEKILDFWFGDLDADGLCKQDRNKLWFQSSDAGDRYIEEEFGTAVAAALAGELDHWTGQPGGLTALVILLDQFTRNIYRGTPAAFSGDQQALALVQAAAASGADCDISAIHRVFLYIPYEHCEDLPTQELGIACFDRLLGDCSEHACEQVAGFRRYSIAHRDVVAQFGRFPHRNEILGRPSSAEEKDHLKKHGGF
jgi:uncharacterized protein (DUF924 family)